MSGTPKPPRDQPKAVLITGFPGFVGTKLLQRLADERPTAHFYLLVEPRFVFHGRRRCEQLGLSGRYHLVPGDLARADLGIAPAAAGYLRDVIDEVWHLAALDDPAAPQARAHAVNVDGTERVLALAASLPHLARLLYVSTCFVSGDRTGRVYEDELDERQDFNNHYEATRFWAEVRVQRRFADMPITVFRPTLVVGDSRTGETTKGGGPYPVVRALTRVPRWLPMVPLGASTAPVNVVPADFVVDAMVALAARPDARGRVFQLADPQPLSAHDLLDQTLRALGRADTVGPLPDWAARRLVRAPLVGRLSRISREPFAGISRDVTYDVTNTADLLGDSLHCPRPQDYWGALVDYARAHPEIAT